MSIESLGAVSIAAPAPLTSLAPGVQASQSTVFDTVLDGIRQVNQQMQTTTESVKALVAGETDNLHQIVMQQEQARLSFELLLQVRNKVLDAYQELMRMQV